MLAWWRGHIRQQYLFLPFQHQAGQGAGNTAPVCDVDTVWAHLDLIDREVWPCTTMAQIVIARRFTYPGRS
jgi:hypothetical protein